MKITCSLIPVKDFPCERKGRNLLQLMVIPVQARDEENGFFIFSGYKEGFNVASP